MLVFDKRQRKFVSGRGFIDFLNANKDTISNVAGVVGNVANAAASTANAAKQIYNVVKARKDKTGGRLTDRSIGVLNNLIN